MNVGWPQCRPKWRCIGTSYASSSNILKAAHHALPAVKKPKYLESNRSGCGLVEWSGVEVSERSGWLVFY